MYNAYNSNREITENPRKTTAKNIVDFIREVCYISVSEDMVTETLYNKYVKYCAERGKEYSNFNVFARSFRYYAFHEQMLQGITIHPVNYQTINNEGCIVSKQGWAYYNLGCNV